MAETEGQPLVSYVVASYNHARFVADAVLSIVNQNYPDIELIVVDDGSTDGSLDILRDLKDRFGFRLIEKENGGVVSAVNCGAAQASGEFIVIHASDDISHPNRTARQVQILQSDARMGFTVGGIRKVDENGKILQDWTTTARKTYDFTDFRKGLANVTAVSCMYRAGAVKSILPLDENISFEDVQLYWRVTEKGFFCLRADDVQALDYRIVKGSLGRSNTQKINRDFRRFVERYSSEPWYSEVISRSKIEMLKSLSRDDKINALKYISKNFSILKNIRVYKAVTLLIMPKFAVKLLSKKF